MNRAATYFFRGLLILAPVVVTAYIVRAVFVALDEAIFSWLGSQLAAYAPQWIRSLVGVAAAITVITAVGMFASNFFGRRIVGLLEKLVERLPLIKLLYNSVRDVLGAFVGDKKSFDHPVLVSLSPDGSAKAVGFVTRHSLQFLGIEGHVAVYLPQSYNFAGNLLLVPSDRVQPLGASSGDVMTFLVSGGVSGREEK
jgi:uncharacterized membrane protein